VAWIALAFVCAVSSAFPTTASETVQPPSAESSEGTEPPKDDASGDKESDGKTTPEGDTEEDC
jgi:hypothetical protein